MNWKYIILKNEDLYQDLTNILENSDSTESYSIQAIRYYRKLQTQESALRLIRKKGDRRQLYEGTDFFKKAWKEIIDNYEELFDVKGKSEENMVLNKIKAKYDELFKQVKGYLYVNVFKDSLTDLDVSIEELKYRIRIKLSFGTKNGSTLEKMFINRNIKNVDYDNYRIDFNDIKHTYPVYHKEYQFLIHFYLIEKVYS